MEFTEAWSSAAPEALLGGILTKLELPAVDPRCLRVLLPDQLEYALQREHLGLFYKVALLLFGLFAQAFCRSMGQGTSI
jgi:hypothetical protein